MNPFNEKPSKSFMETIPSWKGLCLKPYDKFEADPYTKARIILMNGIETEAVMFGHNFHRNCADAELRRDVAFCRHMEQLQQKSINWLSPSNESTLELTIGYEHLAVDLTAWLAMHEPDPYAKACMDFALLEDFDHLYRYSNRLLFDESVPAHTLVRDYVEITPGRPTIAEHRHPMDNVRRPMDARTADIRTILGAQILTAGEQQTMNFYMNVGNTIPEGPGRELYQEIAMVEEEHVTHYGSLLDPSLTWLENMLLHEYTECYLYYSFLMTETDPRIKEYWDVCFEQEVMHLHMVCELLKKHQGIEWYDVMPHDGEFPELLEFKPAKEYIRNVLETQVDLTEADQDFMRVDALPDGHRFFEWNSHINGNVEEVPSHMVIQDLINLEGQDYRSEDMENPVPELRDRYSDNTDLARTKMRKAA